MNRTRLTALAAAATLVAGAAALAPASGLAQASAATPTYSVQTLHFKVDIGPATDRHTCDIVGDLYQPNAATAATPVPAILTTNGFGGSKDDQAGIGKTFASNGYVVLSYSGLGFGGSTCKITLDDPDYDGQAAQQLVSYLGGASGIAYTDAQHTTPAPDLHTVQLDALDHAGVAVPHDPRVGLVGGSYGGGFQFAAASIDKRIDTLVPLITWNDLSYSLGPNNTDRITSMGVSTRTPGATKLVWGLAFSGEGVEQGLQTAPADPSRTYPCPNFADFVCPALVTAGTTGYFQPDAVAALRHASVASFVSKVTVPTLLIQGENDTLFNLNEAVATYRSLKAQGTPVKMIWQSWGHSGGPAPGEIDLADPNPATQYETARVQSWFDHYLKGSTVGTGPQFSYFRDWVPYTGIATPAYADAGTIDVGTPRTYRFSGTALTTGKTTQPGSQSFVTPPAGPPSSINPLDVTGFVGTQPVTNPTDAPGTFAQWSTPTLTAPVTVVGSPVVKMTVSAPTAAASQAAGPAGDLVLFVKVEDVAPDGSVTMIHGLEAPIRIPDVTAPVTVTLPGIVHRFAAGHQLRLVVASGSENYRGGLAGAPVTIAAGPGQTLTVPVVG